MYRLHREAGSKILEIIITGFRDEATFLSFRSDVEATVVQMTAGPRPHRVPVRAAVPVGHDDLRRSTGLRRSGQLGQDVGGAHWTCMQADYYDVWLHRPLPLSTRASARSSGRGGPVPRLNEHDWSPS